MTAAAAPTHCLSWPRYTRVRGETQPSGPLLTGHCLAPLSFSAGHSFAPDYKPLSTLAMAKLVAEMRAVYRAASVEQVRLFHNLACDLALFGLHPDSLAA